MLFEFPTEELTVPGLRHFRRRVTPEMQTELLETIDRSPWQNELRRRVQQYGYRYDYRRKGLDVEARIGPLPDWSLELLDRFRREGLTDSTFNQLIINEYTPGQGISFHVDCRPCFDDTIFSISLGSPCILTMRQVSSNATKDILLEPGDVLSMSGEARYDWQHGIAARKTDRTQGRVIKRGRRVSLTFRRVLDN
ncbi:alpha-ketoglutarate-dependent dioxygenase AlkB [Streptomyces murinus]|uniref:Alkylated DNA repair dioxygenase AlkB n=1 Tax=Streptomyces murinus TaxID=33900 RepID=A0A7W3NIW3_STRMR|nr:alpha-ketoglutarate-dependent dioxygenase AlkB [Streptomyces murinus]MBA9051354.1 alkylated DNA repair dioxygenase AlkB [Streptomyces murinus]UWW92739.1 alpha-ketoglutarate-dependent dioxygenase AlkB [Streptomyces murinus]